MKILLVMPYIDFDDTKYLSSTDSAFPIGLGYIASVLEEEGYNVKIFDFQILKNTINKYKNILIKENFNIVGFSVATITKNNTLNLAKITKEILPESKIMAGGAHTSIYPGDLVENSREIDFEVIGEGEESVLELVRAVEGGKDFAGIKGIFYKSKDKIIKNEPRDLIKNLDEIPPPAHHLFQLQYYNPPPGMFFKRPLLHMITTRGCPFNCIFCDDRKIWRGKCRQRSAENIVEEIEYLKKNFNAREIHFYDDTFTVNKKRIYSLCGLLKKKKINIIWRCSSRVDTVDEEMLKEMYSAGCRSISYGIESGDDEILKKMNKGTTVEQAKNAVRWTNKAGIQAKGFFMLNFPGETIQTTEKTIALSKELELDFAGFNLTVPHHGERLKKLVEENYVLNKKAYFNPSAKMGNEIYFYQPRLPEEYLKKAYKRAAREFYLRPGYIFRMLCKIKNFDMFKSYAGGFFRLFKIRI